jgi:hypothetical protein
MFAGFLRDEGVVRLKIVVQGLFKFGGAHEAGLGKNSRMRPFMRSTMPFVCG